MYRLIYTHVICQIEALQEKCTFCCVNTELCSLKGQFTQITNMIPWSPLRLWSSSQIQCRRISQYWKVKTVFRRFFFLNILWQFPKCNYILMTVYLVLLNYNSFFLNFKTFFPPMAVFLWITSFLITLILKILQTTASWWLFSQSITTLFLKYCFKCHL